MQRLGRRRGSIAVGLVVATIATACIPGPNHDNYPKWSWNVAVGTTTLDIGTQCFNESMVMRIEAPASYLPPTYPPGPSADSSFVQQIISGAEDYYPIGQAGWRPVPGHPELITQAIYMNSNCYPISLRVTRAAGEPANRIRLSFSTMWGGKAVADGQSLSETLCASGYERMQLNIGGPASDPPQSLPELVKGTAVISASWPQEALAPEFGRVGTRLVSPGVVPKGCYTLRWARTTEGSDIGSPISVGWSWFPPDWFLTTY